MSNAATYILDAQTPPTVFIFERGGIGGESYGDSAFEFDLGCEISQVENNYFLHIIGRIEEVIGERAVQSVIVIDMSHTNLYFYRGLVEVAKQNPKINLHFVRIRRNRVETALSMREIRPDFFEFDSFRYTPLENPANVILKANEWLWTNMSTLERAYWVHLFMSDKIVTAGKNLTRIP